jgi:hypothetical protein
MRTYRIKEKQPNPGSDEAIKAGCKCPVIDNEHGKGVYWDEKGGALFWINAECPLHGIKESK